MICILILLPDSVRYYCKIERKSTIRYNDVIKRKIEAEAPGVSKKKKDRQTEKKKGKSLSAAAVSNPHREAPILKVRARY